MLSQKAERVLDLPEGSLTGEARLEIEGNSLLTLDGSCEILEYEQTCIRFSAKSGEIRVTGNGLTLDSLYAKGACVSGHLLSVEFI